MGEAADSMWAVGAARQAEKADLRARSVREFEEAKQLGEQSGLVVQQFSEAHYRIRVEGYFWDIHPGNQRIRRSTPRAPFIFGLNSDWGILDVVRQVVVTLKAWNEAREKAAENPAALVFIDENPGNKPEGETGVASEQNT